MNQTSRISKSWLFNTDSYKISQGLQDPLGFTAAEGYIEARGGWELYGIKKLLFAGLQPFFLDYPMIVTKQEVEFTDKLFKAHGVSFNNILQ